MRVFNLIVGLTVCLSETFDAVSLGGVYRSFEEIRYSYSPECSGRSRILHAFIPNLIRNVAKHSRNYVAESS